MTEKDNQLEKSKTTKKEEKKYLKMGITAFCTIAASILFFFALYRMDDISYVAKTIIKSAEPIIIGLALAYLLMPVKEFIEKHIYNFLISQKVKKENAKNLGKASGIAGAIIFLLIIIGVLIMSLGPALFTSIVGLIDAMPTYIESFVKWISDSGIADTEVAVFIGNSINSLTAELENWARTEILPLVQQYITQITSGVLSIAKAILNFLIGIIAMTYVMSIQEDLVGQCKKIIYAIFPAKKGNVIIDTVRKSNEIFGGFVIGKIIDSAIIGVIAYFCVPGVFETQNVLVAIVLGAASGLSATGTNQAVKQLTSKSNTNKTE